jgi:hypothetical protein
MGESGRLGAFEIVLRDSRMERFKVTRREGYSPSICRMGKRRGSSYKGKD